MLSVSKGTNNEDVSNMNQVLIIQYLQRHGVRTRAQISRAVGLTPASVSKITTRLIDEGILEETGYLSGEKGRRSVGLRLAAGQKKVIGVKLSRRSYSVGVFDLAGNCVNSRQETFTGERGLRDVFAAIHRDITAFCEVHPDICAIGVAVPGPFLKEEGTILLMTETDGDFVRDVSVRDMLRSSDFGGAPVIIRHDANSGAMAEWWFHALGKRRQGTLAHFLVGEGVGAGVIVNGQIFEGGRGLAGEVGHISLDVNGPRCSCGNYGCLERYCSSVSFVRNAESERRRHPSSSLNHFERLSAALIFGEAARGDALALDLTRRTARYIGYGVVILISAYDPTAVVISNEMAQGGELLLETVREVVRERMPEKIGGSVLIELSSFPDTILYGAAAVAIDYCLRNPEILSRKRP